MEITSIVLAGGRSRRLGRDKTLEPFGGETLLQLVVSALKTLNGAIIVVGNAEQSFARLYPDLKVVTDIYPDKGPLGGLYTGLKASVSQYNLVVAGDMPFLEPALIRYMLGVATGFDMVVPRVGHLVEPLHAVYSRECLAPIERLLQEGELQVRKLLNLVKVRYVEANEIDRFDPEHLSFFNINTGADLAKARRLMARRYDPEAAKPL
ncbi:MAG: molybdenum cofactor guanylyltransferase [Chloroflexi bacterium]|nr:molybdenum cofactor guanylyltransferase [Chloroflexota bacterium]